MENEIIVNTIGSVPGSVTLDYAASGVAAEIDRGIRETIKGIRLSVLAMGLGLANIKAKGLYRDLGCPTITQYIKKLSDDTKMDRGNIFNWLRIGETYHKYRSDLEEIGFSECDGPTKLPYLEKALKNNQKEEVFGNIKNMSLREFAGFAKKQNTVDDSTVNNRRWTVSEKGNSFYVDGKLAIIISSKMDRRAAAYFKKLIHVACETLAEEGVIVPVPVRNMREARRFEAAAGYLKMKMGMRNLSGKSV